MNRRVVVIAIVVAGFGTIRGAAQLSTADQAAVDAYRSAISAAESGRSSSEESRPHSRHSVRCATR